MSNKYNSSTTNKFHSDKSNSKEFGYKKTYQGDAQKPYQDNRKKFYQGDNNKPYQDNRKKFYQDDNNKPYQDNRKKFYQDDNNKPYQDNRKKFYQDDNNKPYQDNRKKFYQDDNNKPYQDNRKKFYQDDNNKPYQDNRKKFYQGDNNKPYQDNRKKFYQDDNNKPYQDNRKKFYQDDNNKPYQDNRKKFYQDDNNKPYQDNRKKFYQDDNNKPYQDNRKKFYQDDNNKPYQDNRKKFYQDDNNKPYQERNKAYQTGYEQSERSFGNKPYYSNKSNSDYQNTAYQERKKPPYKRRSNTPYSQEKRNILNKISIEQVIHHLSLNNGEININTYDSSNKQTLYGKINLLAQHNILISADDNLFTLNKIKILDKIDKFLVVKIKKELIANHYLVEARNLDSATYFEEELLFVNLNEKLNSKLIIVEISADEEKFLAKPLFYLDNYDEANINNDKPQLKSTQLAKGIFQIYDGIKYFIPINFKSRTNFILNDAPEELTPRALIEVEIETNDKHLPVAKFLKILKEDKLSTSLSMLSVYQYNLPYEFSEDILTTVASAQACSLDNRKDIRELPLVTIDGEDSKDFDDAIYAEAIPNSDAYKIYVAIADVAYYVSKNSDLDIEAQNRGNSVYLPGYVIPMLPEALSNGWCSLQPDQERGCLLAEMTINRNGIIEDFQFSRCLMKSKARLTYNEVQDALDGNINEHIAPLMTTIINPIFEVYKLLAQERLKRHTLEINMPETNIILDKDDEIVDITIKKSLVAHKIIEEFMISANIAAAKIVSKNNIPSILSIYRTHNEPALEKLEEFIKILRSFNIFEVLPKKINGTFFNHLLNKYKDHPAFNSLTENILRAQQQAIYDNTSTGHFGLGLKEYSHFTSPIRRYADLMVHRLILSIIDKNNEYTYSANKVKSIAEHISITERIAFNAENTAKNRIMAKWFADKIGETFQAYISSITQAGLFVNLSTNGASGLVPIRSISNEYVIFDEKNHTIKNKAQKRLYKLGDKIQVILSATDEIRGLITFQISTNFKK